MKNKKTPPTVNLADFREDTANVSVATDEDIERLVGKLRRNPRGLAAMRIAYVTDDPPGACTVNSGNKRLRVLKRIAKDGGIEVDGAWLVSPSGDVPAEWFCDITFMTREQRREFRLNTNINDGSLDAERLLAQYASDDLAALMSPAALEELLAATEDAAQDAAGETDAADTDEDAPSEDNPQYQAFVDKFKPKKTTDDCYTPKLVYDAVLKWATNEYNLDGREIIRPFRPGGDYQAQEYPPGCVVVDNPPFSILSQIVAWFNERKIDYFLFSPYLTNISILGCNHIIAPHNVTYENGARIDTSFVTNLGEWLIRTAPDLMDAVRAADEENLKEKKKELPKYSYPASVITSAGVGYLAKHHTPFALRREECAFVRALDAQGKDAGIFGGGYIISERAAAERAAAERAAAERAAAKRAAAHVFELSPRELEIQKGLGSEP